MEITKKWLAQTNINVILFFYFIFYLIFIIIIIKIKDNKIIIKNNKNHLMCFKLIISLLWLPLFVFVLLSC